MTVLTDQQIAAYAYRAGFRNNIEHQDLTLSVAVALAESDGNTAATHRNSDSRGTTDLGVWQINNYWHRDLLAKYAWSDPYANAQMAFIIKTQRGGWQQWSTFNHGTFFKYMPRAIKAAEAVQSGSTTPLAEQPTATSDSSGLSASVATITSGHTWLRLAMIVTGGILVLVALAMLGWEGTPEPVRSTAKAAAKTAAKVAVVA